MKLVALIVILCAIFSSIGSIYSKSVANLINRVRQHSNQIFQYGTLNDIMAESLSLSLRQCVQHFQWDQWNCPVSDFLTKTTSSSFDRESAYVQAITIAGLIYTISTNCSNSIWELRSCGCVKNHSDIPLNCADSVAYAEKTVRNLSDHTDPSTVNLNIQEFVLSHNYRAGRLAIRRSLIRQCRCLNSTDSICQSQICFETLKTFSEIALDIRRMFDRSILLSVDNNGDFNQNVKSNALVYVSESPNFCLLSSLNKWQGMKGRQCSRQKTYLTNSYERKSCRTLCRACGLSVKKTAVIKTNRCNCKFNWCCNVTCEQCKEFHYEFHCE